MNGGQMSTTRAQVESSLAVQDAGALRLILEAAEVSPRGAEGSAELAARLTDALWWNYCTPLGYTVDRVGLEEMVAHVAKKLLVDHAVQAEDDAWVQLRHLTVALLQELPDGGVGLADLDEATQARIWPSWMPTVALGSGATGSVGTWWASRRVVAFFKGPVGRYLPLLPVVGPYLGAIRTGAGVVGVVTGPLSVALSILTVNQALGTNYKRLVPLLLGIGALGPAEVVDVEEVT